MKYLILSFFAALFFSCQNNSENPQENGEEKKIFDVEIAKEKYNEFAGLSTADQDTLMTNLTTYIYRKPSSSAWDTKFNAEFRSYFIENRYNLEMTYLHNVSDSLYYYYLLRDARGNNGMGKRGVGGKFYMNNKMTLSGFEEIFNTPIFGDDTLVEIGFTLMNELVEKGNVNNFMGDSSLIEWPDGSLFYSKEKHEWRFVD